MLKGIETIGVNIPMSITGKGLSVTMDFPKKPFMKSLQVKETVVLFAQRRYRVEDIKDGQ